MRTHRRLARERQTLQAMIKIFCSKHHSRSDDGPVCGDCNDLLSYAVKRLAKCPFQAQKPTCGNCPIHCYRNDMQARIREVMGYSGPRMIKHHPLLALRHLFDGMKKPPQLPMRSHNAKDRSPKE